MNPVAVFLPGPVSYAAALRLQEALHAARLQDRLPDTALFLEHRPVITLGRRGRTRHLLVPEQRLREEGIELHVASRGGDVTYHGPGQLVLYPILKLGEARADSHRYLWCLEEIALRTARSFGVEALRRPGMSGAWTSQGKLAAIGFHLKRWVTLHGMSFNVDLDLKGFSLIVGCGLEGEPVTSLKELLGPRAPTVAQVGASMAGHLRDVLERPFEVHGSPASLPAAWRDLFRAADPCFST